MLVPLPVFAQTSSSTNYQTNEYFFGTGGELDASSTNYRAKTSVGELGVGNTSSTNYQAYAGFNTTDDPFIEFVVTSNTVDLGVLSSGSVATTTGTFSIRAWQSGGYVVRTESDPPTAGSHQLSPMTSGGSSSPGTEQFGINLVDNSSPNIGANPQQVPDSSFSFGQAETGYDTVNNFKYNKGDIIARSTKSTSITAYTVSYIFNISSLTPAGQYTFIQDLVATATY
jgi:hypothetical protein